MSIPPLIFQTWKSTTDIPANFAYWSRTFREQNPGYEHRLWDDADNRRFIADHYAWFLPTYDAYPAEIYRADAVRYFFLYHFGGIYADMDTECLRPLDGVLGHGDVVLGRMGANPDFAQSLPNAVMLSRPRQPFWLLVMSLLQDPATLARRRPEFATGPALLRQAHQLWEVRGADPSVAARIAAVQARLPAHQQADTGPGRVVTVPGNVFFPLDWNDRIHQQFFRKPLLRDQRVLDRKSVLSFFPKSLTVSYWAHSWETPAAER
ncbi:glycosyltransferase family 32 protein [Caenimonas aquaedulcis]|uniref:Cell surface protein n=1 Tax=Caenimonas aquaedulcis TaxID=2793270 RepID=A0A931MI50_9BURK|nr:glycosyltransferase [Caenimonas aquaedulcis]MBG9389463.1 cell surface protein [Caenimonas aquaedulcis]